MLQNNCYSKFLKLLENNINFLKQNHFIKKRMYVLLLNTDPLDNNFSILKIHINSRPSLTISKSFYSKRYNNMSNYLKVLYESQNHVRINSRNKLIKTLKTIPNKSQSLFASKY